MAQHLKLFISQDMCTALISKMKICSLPSFFTLGSEKYLEKVSLPAGSKTAMKDTLGLCVSEYLCTPLEQFYLSSLLRA